MLKAATDYLAGKGIPDSTIVAETLMSCLFKCRRLQLPLLSHKPMPDRLLEAMRRGVKRIAAGEPVQYVIGEWDFMGRTFKVDRRALIPRPETEVLVETALCCHPLWAKETPLVADVGTGSGCIVITLALERLHGLFLGLDVSEEAVSLARENAEKWKVNDKIFFSAKELADLVEPESLDAVIVNPPYIPSSEIERLPVWIRDHEPRLALDGGPDGLCVIREIVQDAAIALKSCGWIFIEVGDGQAAKVVELLKVAGFESITITRDLGGKDRIVSAVLSYA